MVHRRVQNNPLQDMSNRPIGSNGPTRTSPRLIRTEMNAPQSSMPGTTGFRPPGSPIKRYMPYSVPHSNAIQAPNQQQASFSSIASSDTLDWSHSVSPAQNPMARIHQPTTWAPAPSVAYQSAFENTDFMPNLSPDAQLVLKSLGAPTLLQSHNSHTDTSKPMTTSQSTSGPITLVIDDDEDGRGHGCTGCKAFPDDTSEELPLADSILDGLPHARFQMPDTPVSQPGELPHRVFEITFNVYQRKAPEIDSVAGRTKKARGRASKVPLKPVKPQWRNYKPLVPTYSRLPVGSFSWSDWRNKVFNACNDRLKGISEALAAAEKGGTLAIQGFINGTDRKTPKFRGYLTDDVTFGQFVHAILAAPSKATVGIKIVHPNPKTNEDANLSLANSLRGSGGGGNSPSDPSDDEDGSESEGSDALTPGEKKYKILMSRFEKAFKSGENVATAINPKDPTQVLLLNTSLIRTWAEDWAQGVPGVDEVNPPMARPNFKWVHASNYEEEKAELLGLRDRRNKPNTNQTGPNPAGTVIHHNYYGQGFPSPGMPVLSPFTTPNMMNSPALPQSNVSPLVQVSRLSPPPNVEYPSFNEFLTFAGIHEGMKKTRDALQNEGIEDFRRLLDRQTYSIQALHGMGIPFAQADDIWKAVPKYLATLKTKV